MNVNLSFLAIDRLKRWWSTITSQDWVIILASAAAFVATYYSFVHGYIAAYGDAESHLNIAKRVVDSLTPGFAQLGGIWLPLPHILLIPFVYSDWLWRSGLAGSIVSGVAFVISAVYLYRLILLITEDKSSAFIGALFFISNPNVLYLQSTPMTELTLTVFFVLSSYFFIKFIKHDRDLSALLLSALFGFCAALSRYDGWFLVLIQAGVVALMYIPFKIWPLKISTIWQSWNSERFKKLEGRVILFASLAFFAIFLWLLWDLLILGDPLYFTHSQFSAKSQQQSWLARGELPAYGNLPVAVLYYFVTSMSNSGVLIFLLALLGMALFLSNKKEQHRLFIILVLLVPFMFNVLTLYLGQSVIFIPHVTPISYEWRLFNVRYGVMMLPLVAFCAAYAFWRANGALKTCIIFAAFIQVALYGIGYSQVISLADGVRGLSSSISKLPDAQRWLAKNYDSGLLLTDDFARTISIIRTDIPMSNIIYIGNKPYWEESLQKPEKYATWIVMQKNDTVWKSLYDDPVQQGRLFKYFEKAYTSPEILIFKRNRNVPAA